MKRVLFYIILITGLFSNKALLHSQLVIISHAGLTELNLSGAMIDVTLTNDTFVNTTIEQVFLDYPPTGVSINSIQKIDTVSAIVYLNYDFTDFDTDTSFKIIVHASELKGASNLTSNFLIIDANDESLSIGANPALTERNLDGADITLSLTDDAFLYANPSTSNFTLENAPTGTSISSVTASGTSATLTLAFNRTDFDTDIPDFSITINSNELEGYHALPSSNSLTITALQESVMIAPAVELNERNLNGANIEVVLSDEIFEDATLDMTNFVLGNAPPGCSINSVTYDSETQATIVLAYTNTDFDADINNFNITVNAAELYGLNNLTSNDDTIIAYDETLTLSDPSLTERTLDGETIDLTLSGDEFVDNTIDIANIELNGFPAGTSVTGVTYNTSTSATVTLAYDLTDFDTDISSVTLTVKAVELASQRDLNSTAISITAYDESLSINHAGLSESNLDGAIVAMVLTDDLFLNATPTNTNFILNNVPVGTTVASVSRVNGTTANLTLAYDGTDFDVNYPNFNISIDGSELASSHSLTSSNTLSITAVVEDPTVTITPSSALVESGLDTSYIDIAITDMTFIDPGTLQPADFTLNNAPTGLTVSSVTNATTTSARLNLDFDGTNFLNNISSFSVTISGSVVSTGTATTSNSISITSDIGPVITNVTIPNDTMIVDDIVNVTISVVNDGGLSYSLVSGSIGGFPVTSLQRNFSTSYSGQIEITENGNDYSATHDIPVSNLILSDGNIQGDAYNSSIVQSNDPVDANSPVVSSLSVTTGDKKVGDKVTVFVITDEEGYIADPVTQINYVSVSSSNVQLNDLGGGGYTLDYTIAEGDNDVLAGELTILLQLIDPFGNKSPIYNSLEANSVAIDANSPVVSSMTVNPGDKYIGDQAVVTIEADGTGYAATSSTTINNISIDNARVNFSHVSGTTYQLVYEIAEGDNSVAAGNLSLSVILEDPAGNESSTYTTLETNDVAIYASLPTATISGTTSICQGDSAELVVELTGVSPWTITYSDGTVSNTIYDITTALYAFRVSPGNPTTYSITSVLDGNGVSNTGDGSAEVTVKALPGIAITNLNSIYSVSSDPVDLIADPTGGTFKGPGVLSSTSKFYPDIAGTVNSPHDIIYTYQDPVTSCLNHDTAVVFIIDANATMHFPDDKFIYCYYDEPFTITAANVANDTGSFSISGGTGLVDHHDNTATVNPAELYGGNFTISYTYFDGVYFTINESITVEYIAPLQIYSFPDGNFCKNDNHVDLVGNNSNAIFSGDGVTGNLSSGFVFEPSNAEVGKDTIFYSYTTANGCKREVTETFEVFPVPDVDFNVNKFCISDISTDSIHFFNGTISGDSVNTWNWSFGDINSGEANYSSRENPAHRYNNAGPRNIKLTATTINGCNSSFDTVIVFGDKPVADFYWDNECFKPGLEVNFTDNSYAVTELVDFHWTFHVNENKQEVFARNATMEFPALSDYQVDLMVETEIGCRDTSRQIVHMRPTIYLADEAYMENFENGRGGWIAEALGENEVSSWKFGTPSGEVIDHASSGTKAWYTGIANRNIPEQSHVTSPCYNFTGTIKPMIKLNIWRSFDRNRDGAVLQYSLDNGQVWSNVGKIDDGIQWYNSFEILNGPGGQGVGWTGEQIFNPDDNWNEARHQLDVLSGYENVRLRIAYGSDGNSRENNEGFAFDNIWIGEREKMVLIEHFTNATDTVAVKADKLINDIQKEYTKDGIDIKYHTAFPGTDSINLLNPADPGARVLFYGISSIPYTIINGGVNEQRYNYTTSEPTGNDINLLSLKDPGFLLDVSLEKKNGNLDIGVDATAVNSYGDHEISLYVVIVEKLIDKYKRSYVNSVRDMLPNAGGITYTRKWEPGDSESLSFSWDLGQAFNPEQIKVVAFIQDDVSKEVYQAYSSDTSAVITSIGENDSFDPQPVKLLVYPNPVNEDLIIETYQYQLPRRAVIEWFNTSGTKVSIDKVTLVNGKNYLKVPEVYPGVYFIRVSSPGMVPVTIRILKN